MGSKTASAHEKKCLKGNAFFEPVWTVRLYRNIPSMIFHEGAVHELVVYSLRRSKLAYKQVESVAIYNIGDMDKTKRNQERRDLYLKLGKIKAEESDKAWDWFQLGVEFNMHNNPAEAESALRKSIELDDQIWVAWLNLGLSLSDQGKYHEALEALRTATEGEPMYAEAWNNMGVTYQRLGDVKKAIKYYEKAVEVDPDYEFAKANLERLR